MKYIIINHDLFRDISSEDKTDLLYPGNWDYLYAKLKTEQQALK